MVLRGTRDLLTLLLGNRSHLAKMHAKIETKVCTDSCWMITMGLHLNHSDSPIVTGSMFDPAQAAAILASQCCIFSAFMPLSVRRCHQSDASGNR